VAALSCNALGEHQKWLDDVVAHCENKITVDFPISECGCAGLTCCFRCRLTWARC
jgi:hypothetical protein